MQVLYVEVGYEQRLADWPQRGLGYKRTLRCIADWSTPCEIFCGTLSCLVLFYIYRWINTVMSYACMLTSWKKGLNQTLGIKHDIQVEQERDLNWYIVWYNLKNEAISAKKERNKRQNNRKKALPINLLEFKMVKVEPFWHSLFPTWYLAFMLLGNIFCFLCHIVQQSKEWKTFTDSLKFIGILELHEQ